MEDVEWREIVVVVAAAAGSVLCLLPSVLPRLLTSFCSGE